jgi:pimeloyl-ACP methyl ester carboxylesterase
MANIDVNRAKLEYVERGQGEPIVFIHGSASDYRTWQNQLNVLDKQFRTIAYSRRYHWPNEPIVEGVDYSMAEHIEDLKILLNTLNAKPAHIIGHSYGALMALVLASEEPKYVRSLVLAEPPAVSLFVSDPPKPLEFLKLLFSRPRTALAIIKFGAKGLEPARKAARKGDMEEAMNLFGRAALGPEKAEHMSEERKKQALVNITKAEFLGSGFLPLKDQKLRNIEVPTLLLTGQLSPIVFYYLTNRLEELIPNTDRIEISAASHIMHEDNASGYNAALLSFLTGQRKSA